MKSPARNEDLTKYQPRYNWLDRFDAEHPLATTVLLTIFLLVAMGFAGWGDLPVA